MGGMDVRTEWRGIEFLLRTLRELGLFLLLALQLCLSFLYHSSASVSNLVGLLCVFLPFCRIR
jgi:hypothetical protein